MRMILAALLLVGGPVHSQDAAFDALSELFTRDAAKDATAAGAIPERGETLARLSADLTLAAQGLEAFRSPEDAERALKLALERVPPELRSRLSSRRQALDTLYRTLAVTDYTWATRFPGENCSALEWRARLLASPDGLFKDPKTGEASTWVVHLLGPDASKGVEKALDSASSAAAAKERSYELLRAKAAKATAALEAASEDKRAWLHCLRAEAYESLARANQASEGPIAASRVAIPSRGVALIGRTTNGVFEAHGAGVLITTKAGSRILTDAKVVGDGEGYQAAFPDKGAPIPVTIERKGETLAVLSSPQDLGEGRELATSDPAKDDLVTVVSHSDRLGAWAWTQGLVSESQDGAFQTDAVVDSAQAGGAVLDENGRVAGLLTLRSAEAEDGEGEWPVGVPASKVKAWLEGEELQTASRPITLQDAGTSSIIQASYIYSQTQWGSVRGKCVANCGSGSSYSGGYSSNPGAEALGRAMGEALGQGARALFNGLGSMFRSKGNSFKPRRSSPSRSTIVKTEKAKPVEKSKKPEPRPKPACELKAGGAPSRAGAEVFEVSVYLECKNGPVPLAGHSVTFTFDWDNERSKQTAVVKTDERGWVVLSIRVANEQTRKQEVLTRSEKSHSDLDAYDPEARDPDEPEESWLARQKQAEVAERGLVETGAPQAEQAATAAAPSAVVATTLARPFVLRGSGALLRVTATATLSPAMVAGGSVILTASAAKVVFDIGWSIGRVAEEELTNIQRGLKAYSRGTAEKNDEEKNDCEYARGWQRTRARISSEHQFKDEWGAVPNRLFDICACKDGRIVIRAHGSCGKSGPTIVTDRRWK